MSSTELYVDQVSLFPTSVFFFFSIVQQMEIQKQHESLRRLQQAQREQLANMQVS